MLNELCGAGVTLLVCQWYLADDSEEAQFNSHLSNRFDHPAA